VRCIANFATFRKRRLPVTDERQQQGKCASDECFRNSLEIGWIYEPLADCCQMHFFACPQFASAAIVTPKSRPREPTSPSAWCCMNDHTLVGETPYWTVLQRIGFRFLFVYLLLYITTFFGIFNRLWLETLVKWVGQKVFGVTITMIANGSGDTTYHFVELFCLVTISAVATIIWSFVDRRCTAYPRLQEALHVGVRHFLALAMITYGAAKVVPMQFGTATPYTFTTPMGERSPMGLLWAFMAVSPYYTSFTGTIEFVSGILLIFRRTSLLGALIAAGALAHVLMLNLCFDVPVKLFSSHLLAMSLFVIAPDAGRLWNFFIAGRPVMPRPLMPRFQRVWLNRLVVGGKDALILLFAATMLTVCAMEVHRRGDFSEPQPLHGVWDVIEYEQDGQILPPLVTEASRWKQFLIIRKGATSHVAIRPMSGYADRREAEFVEGSRSLTLKAIQDTNKPEANFTYEQLAPDLLMLTGKINNQAIRAKLQLAPPDRFLLTTRGFHWINETPFNR